MTASPLEVLVPVLGGETAEDLARCLASVRTHLPDAAVHVWVERRADSAGMRDLAASDATTTWTFAERDRGRAAAVNQMMAGRTADALLLDPRAVVTGPLQRTTAALGAPRTAAVAPTLQDPPAGVRRWDVARRRPTLPNALVRRAGHAATLRGSPLSDLHRTAPDDVDGLLVGPVLLVARAAWDAVGPLDEDAPTGAELIRWQQQARRHGWRVRLVDEPHVHLSRAPDDLDQTVAAVALGVRGNGGPGALLLGADLALERLQPRRIRERRRDRRDRARRAGGRHAVVVTTPDLIIGGAERQRVLLANGLAERGHPVTLVCLQQVGALQRELHPDVRVLLRPYWQPVLDAAGERAVLVSGTTRIEVAMAAAWRRSGVGRQRRRWLVAAHEFPRAGSGPLYARDVARGIGWSDGMIVLSPLHWAALTSRHPDLHERHFSVPNGVALQADRGYRPHSPLRLAFSGRIIEFKNPHLLVAALARLAELPWELDLFGIGPDLERMRAEVPDDVRDRVRFRGEVPGPDEIFADTDVLCMPSRHDAFPLAVLEAMARGVPVMASAIGGLPDMLGHGRDGVLVPEPTLDAWVAALRPVLEDPSRLAPYARAGWERVKADYTVDVMIDGYQRVLAEVLSS